MLRNHSKLAPGLLLLSVVVLREPCLPAKVPMSREWNNRGSRRLRFATMFPDEVQLSTIANLPFLIPEGKSLIGLASPDSPRSPLRPSFYPKSKNKERPIAPNQGFDLNGQC